MVFCFSSAELAAYIFQPAGEKSDGTPKAPPSPIPTGNYNVTPEQLTSMTRDHDMSALQNFDGVKGLSEMLKTNPDKGIDDDESNILDRKNEFGSNTYPRKKGRSFWRFLLDACRDTTLIILMVAAAASLALGIKSEGIKEGWYDGGSIALAVIIVIVVTAISDYKQSLQFQNLNEEKQSMHVEVVRGGRRVEISIFDIVVGDVIPLKIGDQVPADGVLIFGHSLSIDESSMTGESEIVHKDHKSPFLMSGCKVADGYGIMLATSVGINTEWGLLMASISEDYGEETPLQVRLNGVATFIGRVGLVVAVSVLVILLVSSFTGHTEDDEGRVEFIAGKTSVGDAVDGAIKIFIVAVTIVVVAVPEGLTLAVSLTLAYSTRKMMMDKALVMGRSSPNDKLLLVQALRKSGHVVAVTGDGTNDAPALHEADIGLAMGIQGTEVAKESSDIIILDDDFASVVKVVRWGRSVYANIQKFIQFQLKVNVAALVINVVAAVSSGDVPLNAVQLLWVNLIMVTLGALALATEPPTDHLIDRHPVGRREPLITNIMWRNLLIQAAYQVTVLLTLNFRGIEILNLEHDSKEHAKKVKNTLIFNAFVFAQIFNEFNARKPDEMNVFKGVTKNRLFMAIVGLTVVLQVVIVMFLGKFTSTVRLGWQLWLVSVTIGFMSWPLAVIGKLMPVSKKPLGKCFTNTFASCAFRRRKEVGNQDGK